MLSNKLDEELECGAVVALIDGFPRSVEQALKYEQTVCMLFTPMECYTNLPSDGNSVASFISFVTDLVYNRETAMSRCVGGQELSRPDEYRDRFQKRYDDYQLHLGPIKERYFSRWEEVDAYPFSVSSC